MNRFSIDQATSDWLFAEGQGQPYDRAIEQTIIDGFIAKVDSALDDFSAAAHWGDRAILARQTTELIWTLSALLTRLGISVENVWETLVDEKLRDLPKDKADERIAKEAKPRTL